MLFQGQTYSAPPMTADNYTSVQSLLSQKAEHGYVSTLSNQRAKSNYVLPTVMPRKPPSKSAASR
jgi:hypothetical protein